MKSGRRPNKKQTIFIDALMGEAQGNATEAARIAGYKHPNVAGAKLVKISYIEEEMLRRRKNIEEEVGATRQEKRKRLELIMGGNDDRLAMQAIDIDNKMCAEYVQKMEVQHNFQDLSDDEVLKRVIEDLRERGYKVELPK